MQEKRLLTKMVEEVDDENKEEFKKKFDVLQKIIYFLKTYTLFIIDEIDNVMDLTKTLNFNTHHIEKHDQDKINEIIEEFYQLKKYWKNIRNNQSYDETILNKTTNMKI